MEGYPLHAEDWEVRPVPIPDARVLVEQYHYAKGASNTGVYLHGLYLKYTDELFGVVWWLPPTRVACESVNKDNWKKVLSLTRMVMRPDTPKNACSFLLSKSIKIIKKRKKICIVSYLCR